jgi:hypothetical protein
MLGDTRTCQVVRYLAHTEAFTIAIIKGSDGEERIGMTWNPDPKYRPSGFPNSRGKQQWFVVHPKLVGHFLDHERSISELLGKPPATKDKK